MASHKRQHYVPASYLAYFAIDQSNCNRKSFLWRVDKKAATPVTAESQCALPFHYSELNARFAEEHFQRFEGTYCASVDAIHRGKVLPPEMYGNLLLSMLVLHLRNAAHVNCSGLEGFVAYQQRWALTLAGLLLGDPTIPLTQTLISDHVSRHWQLQILETPSDSLLLTSDNPSIWITFHPESDLLDAIILPLTPRFLAVAFDKRRIFFRNLPLTSQTVSHLNGQQLSNSIAAIYSSQPLAPEAQMNVHSHYSSTEPATKTEFTDELWTARLAIWPTAPEIGFITAPLAL